uniref:A disintegrin and metalloproteinase with thrombospondin motifs adt-1 isoform X2 n=1 Tax=Ciona intestinalis TaxID=7719 RepID=UPI000EF4B0F3|nr:A disintegrin and metalloproteinase with thrombospondin motifs adt-1 isoform X2 [Ciona intestinalis]|eukprot:XP_026692087.1 A disintegrin and metalloproteinase with thrombospondin motifs adt-1 isoform X2 [Ciona intestinalis]
MHSYSVVLLSLLSVFYIFHPWTGVSCQLLPRHTPTASDCVDQYGWCIFEFRSCGYTTVAIGCRRTCNNCYCNAVQYGCEHFCTNNGSSVNCICRTGYRLHRNGRNCTDIDECVNHPCSRTEYCVNTPGSYYCSSEFVCPNANTYQYYLQERCCRINDAACGQNPLTGSGVDLVGPNQILTQWPWTVFLHIGNKVCTGVLVLQNWIIVPSRCFSGWRSGQTLSATFGAREVSTGTTTGQHPQTINLAEVYRHPSYSFPHYDIAVAHLDNGIRNTDSVKPICLPFGEVPPDGVKCFLVGYEAEVSNGALVRVRKDIAMNVTSIEECRRNVINGHQVENNMICAKYDPQQLGACVAESGGPLMCQRCTSCNWYVAGIFTFGDVCVKRNSYAAFTSVEPYEGWLSNRTGITIQKDKSCGARIPVWRPWTSWSTCDTSCGDVGQRTRSRICWNGNPGDAGCLGNSTEISRCNIRPCPRWTFDNSWSSCSRSCGGGILTRVATCINGQRGDPGCDFPIPRNTLPCNQHFCPTWSDWSPWTRCSSTCGTTGTQRATRVCHGTGGCNGLTERIKTCNRITCPVWSTWSSWTECPRTCGGGVITSRRVCEVGTCPGSYIRTDSCASQRCPVCEDWERWSSCSRSCGPGRRIRERQCSADSATEHNTREEEACNAKQCSVWGTWQSWSSCTEACGRGRKSRVRSCLNGRDCRGRPRENRTCYGTSCPGVWSRWSSWGDCSNTCGVGVKTRQRDCTRRGSSNGPCVGSNNQTKSCTGSSCRGDCSSLTNNPRANFCERFARYCSHSQYRRHMERYCAKTCCLERNQNDFAQWSPWSKCSKDCGVGEQRRQRRCRNRNSCRRNDVQRRRCQGDFCGRTLVISDWTDCTATCGGGERLRPQNCSVTNTTTSCVPFIVEACATQPCAVENSTSQVDSAGQTNQTRTPEWGEWSICSATCGLGVRIRQRACDIESSDGCTISETGSCQGIFCPGTWSAWSVWSTCTRTCGTGTANRLRTCLDGLVCTGLTGDLRYCGTTPCAGNPT